MAWKYIMFRTAQGQLLPVIFPDVMVHNEVANGIRRAHPPLRSAAIESAGTIDGISPFNLGGDSETLRLQSIPGRDNHVITSFQYNHGYDVQVQTGMSDAARNLANPQRVGTLRPGQPAQRVGDAPARPRALSSNGRQFLRLTNRHRGTGHGDDHGRE